MQQNLNCLKERIPEKLFGKPETYDYSEYENIEGFNLDGNLMKDFLNIAEKLNLSQEAFKNLMDIAFNMSKKQNEIYENNVKAKLDDDILKWSSAFDEDVELPNKNSSYLKQYMSVADDAYNEFATPKLKELMVSTGLVYHPEMIKMFHKIGEIMQEDMMSYGGKPVEEELTPAQILYGPRE